ncbi:MAG: hypothetical protein D6737_10850 [Chloroflexi bacterium]|nr:MAG: hypothetical protein CUN54_06440 [Phototrophicales bacterium]RMF79629.1 MAG: hypothetical protein D6737_10850 [Chloroflexota bacterium]
MRDTLIGLLAVIQPSMPKRRTFVAVILGFLIGLFWAYNISPTTFFDADPSQLDQTAQDEWVRLLADRKAAANFDVTDNIVQLLAAVDEPLEIVNRLGLDSIRAEAEQANEIAATAPNPNFLSNLIPIIVGPLVLIIVMAVGGPIWNLLIKPFIEPYRRRITRRASSTSDDVAAQTRAAMQEAKKAQATLSADYSTSELGAPVMQRMTSYLQGHGQYDDSFAIEDENDMFLGETGAAISETLDEEGKNVTAIEIWLFDKEDFVRTITKVFATPYAMNDPALRAKLETKGELVLIEPGGVAILETNTLQLHARIAEVTFNNDGANPPNSVIEKMSIELAAWRKEGVGAATPATPMAAPQPVAPTAPPLPEQPAPVPTPGITPPPPPRPIATPQSPQSPPPSPPTPAAPPPPAAPPTPAGQPQPLQPPPMQNPSAPQLPSIDDDDDPFGGTGDFTPLGR